MQKSTKQDRRRAAVRTTALCGAVLLCAAAGTLWTQRTFWPEGVLARLLPYTALFYLLLLPALAVSLRTKLRRIDLQEEEPSDQAHDD
ncbi:hypothetical protein [Dysosmobacter sp.]